MPPPPLQDLFRRLDVDSTGRISLENLKSILGNAYDDKELQDIITEVRTTASRLSGRCGDV
jgi:Ca2+-binding EF-hand superfamily protein